MVIFRDPSLIPLPEKAPIEVFCLEILFFCDLNPIAVLLIPSMFSTNASVPMNVFCLLSVK